MTDEPWYQVTNLSVEMDPHYDSWTLEFHFVNDGTYRFARVTTLSAPMRNRIMDAYAAGEDMMFQPQTLTVRINYARPARTPYSDPSLSLKLVP